MHRNVFYLPLRWRVFCFIRFFIISHFSCYTLFLLTFFFLFLSSSIFLFIFPSYLALLSPFSPLRLPVCSSGACIHQFFSVLRYVNKPFRAPVRLQGSDFNRIHLRCLRKTPSHWHQKSRQTPPTLPPPPLNFVPSLPTPFSPPLPTTLPSVSTPLYHWG